MRTEILRKTVRGKAVQKTKKNKFVYFSAGIIALIIIGLAIYFLLFDKFAIKQFSREGIEGNSVQTPSDISSQSLNTTSVITIAKAVLSPEYIDGKDIIKVVAEAKGYDSDKQINMRYEWKINGQNAGDGSDTISGFKRGDKVAVKITPYTEDKVGRSVTLDMQIANSTPGVFGGKELINDGKTFSYQVNAQDPDGDQLSYELLTGPEGMTIDKKSGVVNWLPKENNNGEQPVKIKISDGHGGEITYQMTTTIPKELPPPAQANKKTP